MPSPEDASRYARALEHTVVVGVIGGAAYYNDPADVRRYVVMLAALEGLAVFGAEARTELRLIADRYRAVTGPVLP